AFSVRDIQNAIAFKDKFLRFYWDYHQNLAYQRIKFLEGIKNALIDASEGPFHFSQWQRILRYKYSLEPLSVDGSMMDPGGRFNIGDINPDQFNPFPSIYLASKKATALQEALCQKIFPGNEEQSFAFALAESSSFVNISISGSLKSVINLNHSA